jgi:hypothetical protein
MSAEARFLAATAADLVALTSRLQTASIEADYLFFLGVFVAILTGKDLESQTLTETVTETVMFFHHFTCPITSCITVFTAISGTFHKLFFIS